MDMIDEMMKGFEEPTEVTISKKQFDTIINMVYRGETYKDKHFKEVRTTPKNAICIGYEQAAYGDWNYYVTEDGEFVCTYYSIGD